MEIQYWINHNEPESLELAHQMRNAGIDFASLPTTGPSTLYIEGHANCYGPIAIKYAVNQLIDANAESSR